MMTGVSRCRSHMAAGPPWPLAAGARFIFVMMLLPRENDKRAPKMIETAFDEAEADESFTI